MPRSGLGEKLNHQYADNTSDSWLWCHVLGQIEITHRLSGMYNKKSLGDFELRLNTESHMIHIKAYNIQFRYIFTSQ